MREAFRAEAAQSGRPELLITMAAPADPDKIEKFDPAACAQYLDWYNLSKLCSTQKSFTIMREISLTFGLRSSP